MGASEYPAQTTYRADGVDVELRRAGRHRRFGKWIFLLSLLAVPLGAVLLLVFQSGASGLLLIGPLMAAVLWVMIRTSDSRTLYAGYRLVADDQGLSATLACHILDLDLAWTGSVLVAGERNRQPTKSDW